MFSLPTFLTTILGLCAILSNAQTPPGYSPASNTHLIASFGALLISPPGLHIPLNGTTPIITFQFQSLTRRTATKIQPSIHLPPKSNATAKSLLLMLDLDAPYSSLNRSLAPYLHWLQPDLSLAATDSSTPAVAPYVAPAPPPGSPEHRYVLFAFSQPPSSAPFVMPEGYEGYGKGEGLASNRTIFDLAGFAQAAGLGEPVAADWFKVAPEVRNATGVEFQGGSGRAGGGMWVGMVGAAVVVGFMGL
ncbi:PEBP-like protein [Mytilinidion resinicola]|uniref:PEBP-like protein n=1 Tax=Mytilinidion resinicola TaxID=574789 RepID=A0A6A6YF27_9PEZI|nr:PEBP-like protein [Mytilinidion resinicola]KAF2807391.1 PEBP-like protein [Mytilinidion resinicola]